MCMVFFKYGRVKFGGLEKFEISMVKWFVIIMFILFVGGGVFWVVVELMYYLMMVLLIYDGIFVGMKEVVMFVLV